MNASVSNIIRQLPSLPQSQHALCDQMSLLWAVANRLGLYDAADFIRPHMARPEENSGLAFPPHPAAMTESADEQGLNPCAFGRASSTLAGGTEIDDDHHTMMNKSRIAQSLPKEYLEAIVKAASAESPSNRPIV